LAILALEKEDDRDGSRALSERYRLPEQRKLHMKNVILAAVVIAALSATLGFAQAPADDPHHSAAAGTPQATLPTGQAAASGQLGMMGNMPMMNMMGVMPTMGGGPAGMVMIDRVEGRIAFLRTELKIADAQAYSWNAFADALRTNGKKLGEVRASMISHMGAAQQQPPALTERLNLQEQWLIARFEGTRAIQSAFTNLYAVLSEERKETASELLGPHMGLGMMEMMAGQMQPGQMPGMMQRTPGGKR
jgi:hypothetical protein